MRCLCIVRQEKETFAVGVKSADRVHIAREWAKIAESLPPVFIGKLSENSARFVEEDIAKSQPFLMWRAHCGCGKKIPRRAPRGIMLISSEGN